MYGSSCSHVAVVCVFAWWSLALEGSTISQDERSALKLYLCICTWITCIILFERQIINSMIAVTFPANHIILPSSVLLLYLPPSLFPDKHPSHFPYQITSVLLCPHTVLPSPSVFTYPLLLFLRSPTFSHFHDQIPCTPLISLLLPNSPILAKAWFYFPGFWNLCRPSTHTWRFEARASTNRGHVTFVFLV